MVIADVVTRLHDWGIESVESDDPALSFTYEKVVWMVKNRINSDEIPEGLEKITIDMVCAEYLKFLQSLGKLTEIEIESVTASSISMGDTTVNLGGADATPEQKFNSLINGILTGHEEDFIRYRRMVW